MMILINFRPAIEEDQYKVVFQNDESEGAVCASQVGWQGGNQTIQLGHIQCFNKRTIMHEILHAIGSYHEHNRLDRGQYIQIHDDCIRIGVKGNFKVSVLSETYGIPYNAKSIMHYKATQGGHGDCNTITSLVS